MVASARVYLNSTGTSTNITAHSTIIPLKTYKTGGIECLEVLLLCASIPVPTQMILLYMYWTGGSIRDID
jgi:hypothetical protein